VELTDMPNDASTDGVFFFHHLTKEQAIEVAKQLNSLDDYMYGKKSINPKDPIFYAAVQETKWKG
jgi:hypothetical protein